MSVHLFCVSLVKRNVHLTCSHLKSMAKLCFISVGRESVSKTHILQKLKEVCNIYKVNIPVAYTLFRTIHMNKVTFKFKFL